MSDKNPWESFPEIWPTKAKFTAFLRGGLREGLWNTYPVKIEFKNAMRRKILNPNPKGRAAEVWGGTCYLCGEDFIQNDLQVDHIVGNHKFTGTEDLQSYLEALLFIDFEDLALVCKSCHKIKSYAERYGMTFEEAKLAKQVISFSKKPLTEQVKFLESVGVTLVKGTKKECKEKYSEHLSKN